MNWINLNNEKALEEIKQTSHDKPVVIFKHSTRCSISSAAWSRLQRSWKNSEIKDSSLYYLDLLSFRNISNLIEETFDVEHQSPQLLLIENGQCTYHTSHLSISFDEIQKRIPA
jgi:bacillithiol system protein YtxJ